MMVANLARDLPPALTQTTLLREKTKLTVLIKIVERNMSAEQQKQEPLWSSIERRCLSLLQRPNTKKTILQIHSFMLRNSLGTNVNLLTKFITACCSITTIGIQHARLVFDCQNHGYDSFLCNSMIKAYIDHHQFVESMTLYRDLRSKTCFSPDNYTFPSLLKSCASNSAFGEGIQLHDQIIKMGLYINLFVSTALIDVYAKFGNMVSAKKVFDEMPDRSQVSWTAMIVGYARAGEILHSRELFDCMPEKDVAAYNAMIDAYVKSGNVGSGRWLFDEMSERNIVSWTTLIDGYCKHGDLNAARSLFEMMPEKNLVSWNAMISGYSQNKKPREALELFQDMQSSSSFEPDDVTIVSILPAFADLGAESVGWVLEYARRKRLDRKTNVCTALVDMYMKRGDIMKAKQLFDKIPNRELASWNVVINGLAINGRPREALEVFSEMQREGLEPNEITMIGVLSACNHGGLVEEGKKWFEAMQGYSLTPRIDHYGCMVDILGRAGHLDEAEELIKNMPYNVNGIILSSYLFACACHGDVVRAERVKNIAFEMEPWNDGNYVMMRNLYAAEKRWKDMEEIEGLMRKNRAKKEIGCSVIEVSGKVWEFVAGDKVHPELEVINRELRQLRLHMKEDLEDEGRLKLVFCL